MPTQKIMTSILQTATSGKRIVPVFVLIHGVDGVGKTTFASQAPSPLFIGLESGTNQLDVTRLPTPGSYQEFLQQLTAVRVEAHGYKTLVLDTLDWLEPLIWTKICQEANVVSIEKFEGGYGKGYVRALDYWREVVRNLMAIQNRMHIITIAHTLVKKFDDPEQLASYDRYLVALQEKAAALMRQAVDAVLFANFKTKVINIREGVQGAKGKGKGSAERVMYTESRPAFEAKNRFGLPFEMPLDWKNFGAHVKAFYTPPVTDPAPLEPPPAPIIPPEPTTNGGTPNA
jgi:hypothetical protein